MSLIEINLPISRTTTGAKKAITDTLIENLSNHLKLVSRNDDAVSDSKTPFATFEIISGNTRRNFFKLCSRFNYRLYTYPCYKEILSDTYAANNGDFFGDPLNIKIINKNNCFCFMTSQSMFGFFKISGTDDFLLNSDGKYFYNDADGSYSSPIPITNKILSNGNRLMLPNYPKLPSEKLHNKPFDSLYRVAAPVAARNTYTINGKQAIVLQDGSSLLVDD